MRFEKVSLEQYIKDSKGDTLYSANSSTPIDLIRSGKAKLSYFEDLWEMSTEEIYDRIKLPQRSTKKSAGYDFYAPYGFMICPGQTLKLATGIRVILDEDKFLMCAPRSGHGFKARLQLDNTVGIIDADYSESDNEGHIMLKLTNDSRNGVHIQVNSLAGMMQAIILQYFTVADDTSDRQRNGGFGSTDNKEDVK